MDRLTFVRFRDSQHCSIAPLIAAGAIAAGSALVGGALNRGPSEAQQRRQAYDQYEAEFRAKMDMAKRYGLSPLVTVGTPGSFQATPAQSPYVDLGPAAELFGKHFEQKAGRESPENTELRVYNQQLRAKNLTRLELENSKLAGDVREGDMRRVAMWNEMLRDAMKENTKPTDMFIDVVDDEGKTHRWLNPNLSGSLEEGGKYLTGKKWLEGWQMPFQWIDPPGTDPLTRRFRFRKPWK